jgi:hypothetical protein
MATIQPQGEDIRRAVKWISEERETSPDKKLSDLISQAGRKFDLSPLEEEFLLRCLQEKNA